jgi:hypothetical protein
MYKKFYSKYYMARKGGDFVFLELGNHSIYFLGLKENDIEEKTYTINIVRIGYYAC